MWKKFAPLAAIGVVLLLSGVAFSAQYRFKPPVNVGPPINTTFNERDPFITADGQKLFYVTDWPEGNLDIWMSTWNGTSWGTPVNCGPNINSGLNEWSPSTSPDGKKLYFIAFGRPDGQGSWDVMVSNWDSTLKQWEPAQSLGTPINTPWVDWCPEISRDGQSLYYSSDGLGHPRGFAMYVSHWNGSSWGPPAALPDSINNTATEERPSLTADEKTLYFVRSIVNFGPQIFVAKRTSVNSTDWSQPIRLDSSINDSCGTGDPFITADGSKLYFSSGKGKGTCAFADADIWYAERDYRGDLNMDDYLSPADIVLQLNKVFLNVPFPAPEERGDLNCDGQFTPADVVLILNWIFLETLRPCS